MPNSEERATILVACAAHEACGELSTLLERDGIDVVEMDDADSVLLRLKRGDVHLVIVGSEAGEASQFSLARSIKRLRETHTIPVICVVPRHYASGRRAGLLENGMDGYILYPFEAREALATIRALLRLARTRVALEASEKRAQAQFAELDAIYDSAPVGLCVLDRDLRYVRINTSLADMNGVPPDAHIGRSVGEIVPDVAPALEPALRRVIETGTAVLGLEIRGETRARPGEPRVWIENWLPIVEARGEVVGVNITAEDVTERKRAEEAFAFLADAGRTLSDSLDAQAILSALAPLTIPRVADWALVQTFDTELSPGQRVVAHGARVTASTVRSTTRGAVDDRRDDPFARVIANRRGALFAAVPASFLDSLERSAGDVGDLRGVALVSAAVTPMIARGRLVGVLTLGTAESGRRYTEHELALAEMLAGRVALALENARLYSELREETRRKDEFLAMLAHELRNPLAPILTSVSVLERVGQDTTRAASLRAIIARQARHVSRLVDDLLDVARLRSGKVALERQAVDLRDAVRRSVDALRHTGRGVDHDLRMAFPAEPVVVDADVLRLEQIIGNLVDNAIKYTPPARAIRVTVSRDGGAGAFLVSDEGIGIAPEMLARMFEPFVQAEQSAARVDGGLGLGLALVRALVEQHGGSVTAHSAGVGQGTEFIVRLPLAQTAAASGPAHGAAAPARPLKILLIEDNDDARTALQLLLESDGHAVVSCGDGEEGLQRAESFEPDVAIIDIGLPHLDGYEVARRLRALRDRRIRLVALTGYGQPADRERATAAGFDAHLVKPVDDTELAAALTAA